MSNTDSLSPNTLSFLALANEYCRALETTRETDRDDFIDNMLRLLPRIYITATDLSESTVSIDEMSYIPGVLDEDYYDTIRRSLEMILGEDDTYLEVFESNMKYSDTPIAANISENLADLFQVFFNFIENVKDAPNDVIRDSIANIKEDFGAYWSQPLCNVMRALNQVKYRIQ